MASKRVVSSVTSRIEGRGVATSARLHAAAKSKTRRSNRRRVIGRYNRLMEQTAEEIVATSDDRAVRMAFDERNLGWFRVMLVLTLVYAGILLIVALRTGSWPRTIDLLANVAVDLTLLLALRDKVRDTPFARFLRAHLPAVIIATAALQTIFG